MKKIYLSLLFFLALFTGCKEYEYNIDFTAPETLTGAESVEIDPTKADFVIFSWEGGSSADGSPLLYDVLFDRVDGNFSAPFYIVAANKGTQNRLSLGHAELNQIAKAAGINPNSEGSFKWCVRAAKGGEMKLSENSVTMTVKRPDLLDVSDKLFVFGTALAEGESGTEMSAIGEGRFIANVTFEKDGTIWFADNGDGSSEGGLAYWYDSASGKLMQGDGKIDVTSSSDSQDITVDLVARTYTATPHFAIPQNLYLYGDVAEAGQKFRKVSDNEFVIFTKFASAGKIYFSTTASASDPDASFYYINAEGKLMNGQGQTDVAATAYNADKITVNVLARTMKLEQIGDMRLEWVNVMKAVDANNPNFKYVSDGVFSLTFDIPADFEHVDEENKGGTAYNDARYVIKVNYDPANPMPSDSEIKATPAADRKIRRWGCRLTKDYNMTIAPYDRKHTSGVTHSAWWLPAFETGELDGEAVDAASIIEEPYYVYTEMPNRWKSNFFFKSAFEGSRKTATIYTNKDNNMSIEIK